MAMEAQRKGRGGGGGGNMEKRAKHYSSKHKILLVGEGDFSFALSLANSFGSAHGMVASSRDTYDELVKKYKKAKSNLANLGNLGATILHGVDATTMKHHNYLSKRKFDRIIFNFPHAGFFGREDDIRVIEMHTGLVDGFFRNAKDMLKANGEIHVTHKTSIPYSYWGIQGLARRNDLAQIGYADFKIADYPGYNNKRGAGNRSDEPFPLGNCCTFKFILFPTVKMISGLTYPYAFAYQTSLQHKPNPIQVQHPNPFHASNCLTRLATNADYTTERRPLLSTVCVSRNSANQFQGHHAYERYWGALIGMNYPAYEVHWHEPERFMMEAPGGSQRLLADPTTLQQLPGPFYPSQLPSSSTKLYDCQRSVGAPIAMNITSRGVNDYFGSLNTGWDE